MFWRCPRGFRSLALTFPKYLAQESLVNDIYFSLIQLSVREYPDVSGGLIFQNKQLKQCNVTYISLTSLISLSLHKYCGCLLYFKKCHEFFGGPQLTELGEQLRLVD